MLRAFHATPCRASRVSLVPAGFIDLPAHEGNGGFDHAAVHVGTRRLWVAHTVNGSLDVIDLATDRYAGSIPGLPGVAGALVAEADRLVFTSNRGERTVGVFAVGAEAGLEKIAVGGHPNGLAFDPASRLLLAANVGGGNTGGFTVSLVDLTRKRMVADLQVPGRTRWTIFDPATRTFYVNIADPALIVAVSPDRPDRIAMAIEVPAAGPHGLDLDPATGRLFCACDTGRLVAIEVATGRIVGDVAISGGPDVIFFNAAKRRLYIAVGDPGLVDVVDTDSLRVLESVPTEAGAHTLGFDSSTNKVYAFLPHTHRAMAFVDR